MLILQLLNEEDKYGYQMTQEIKKRSNGEIRILKASMYPILTRLMENENITSYRVEVTPKLSRVYYHITDTGKRHLRERKEAFSHAVNTIYQIMQIPEE